MTDAQSALVERLKQRALARLSLKRPSGIDRADALLDNQSAAALTEALAEVERSEKHRNDLFDKIMSQLTELGAMRVRATAAEAKLAEANEANAKLRKAMFGAPVATITARAPIEGGTAPSRTLSDDELGARHD